MTDPHFIQKNIRLAPYTSWQVGGEAEYFCLPKTLEEIQTAQSWAKENAITVTILGGGSNVLISDGGIQGLTICLKNFAGTEVREENGQLKITAKSGTSKSELLKIYLKHQLAPALFLAGIPGDVGGGIVMNAGVAEMFKPREFVELTEWIEVLRPNNQIEKISGKNLKWVYRHSDGWQPGIITAVGLSWPLEKDPTVLTLVRDANKIRLSKQPLDLPSCGSVFKNPEGHKAAQLTDSCGLKGYTVGGAQVSKKHANFIVNIGEAKATDIWEVIQHVQKTVKEKTGVQLTTEVVRLGRWSN